MKSPPFIVESDDNHQEGGYIILKCKPILLCGKEIITKDWFATFGTLEDANKVCQLLNSNLS